jgi:hypothetical protein
VKQRLWVDQAALQHSDLRHDPTGTRRRSQSRRKIGSLQIQRRASGWTPARSPKQHRPGGSPDDEA